jgi:hypothetical protein
VTVGLSGCTKDKQGSMYFTKGEHGLLKAYKTGEREKFFLDAHYLLVIMRGSGGTTAGMKYCVFSRSSQQKSQRQ